MSLSEDDADVLRAVGMTHAITLSASLALTDAVAAARESTAIRQAMFASMMEEAKQLPLLERLAFIKELVSFNSDLTTRMETIFEKFDGLRSNNAPPGPPR